MLEWYKTETQSLKSKAHAFSVREIDCQKIWGEKSTRSQRLFSFLDVPSYSYSFSANTIYNLDRYSIIESEKLEAGLRWPFQLIIAEPVGAANENELSYKSFDGIQIPDGVRHPFTISAMCSSAPFLQHGEGVSSLFWHVGQVFDMARLYRYTLTVGCTDLLASVALLQNRFRGSWTSCMWNINIMKWSASHQVRRSFPQVRARL